MAKQEIHTEIDGRKLKLSNPTKVLYKSANVSKAEIIQYSISTATYLLPHIKDRPLTLIRFPEGIHGTKFYSKNKPEWTPKWIASTDIADDHDNHYVLAKERATLVWIANLAGLEIHPMNVRAPSFQKPDQFIFDLDPSEAFDFEDLKKISKALKEHIESYGYNTYIKTSGSKGLHIYLPLKPIHHRDKVYETLEKVAKSFVKKHPDTTTLSISKEKRKGKILLDILRNKSYNSCVAPYSLRAKEGAPISMPFRWEELDEVKSSKHWDIRSAQAYLKEKGDAWADIWDNATDLHTEKKIQKQAKQKPKSLSEYDKKRDFSKTSEPPGDTDVKTSGRDYCVQLHDATNLHYDLRLEYNGVLLSWAIPKGLPEKKGKKRLAIRTEDHPLKYINFEGEIPKGEYGGGTMWIFDHGTYEIIKKEEKKIHFILKKGSLQGEYVIYNTKDKQWIIERKDLIISPIEYPLKPMLASAGKKIPSAKDYFFEIKWDGIRAVFVKDGDRFNIFSRNGNDITDKFPLLQSMKDNIEAEMAILDGEIVHLDAKGRPDFAKIVGRIHVIGEKTIALAAKKSKATAYLYDVMYLDGKDCTNETNERRREWLKAILSVKDNCRYSDSFPDGKALFEAIKLQSMEGIICKLKKGKYNYDRRSDNWLKIKVRHDDEAYIIGFSRGEGERTNGIGALHLAKKNENEWQYMGKVGTGFDAEMLRDIQEKLEALPTSKKLIDDTIEKEVRTVWVEPSYICELSYASMSSNGTYREPVYKRMREV